MDMDQRVERLPLVESKAEAQRIERLKTLFPETVRDGQIDIGALEQLLGGAENSGKERFGLAWPGKSSAVGAVRQASVATLRPRRDLSAGFDQTGNILVEGDNLEVLRLFQKSYHAQVKMIYIDPPYNTGSDFVYRDNFRDPVRCYLESTGQVRGNGLRTGSNAESDGRFHSNWLSMMYPRVALARNLLRDDGVMFVSIDEQELGHLLLVMNELFGEENREGVICWRRRYNQPNDRTKMIGKVAEFIVAYAKNSAALKVAGVGKIDLTGRFSNPDNDPRGPWASKPWKVGSDQTGSRYVITTPTGRILDGEWMGEQRTFDTLMADGRIVFPDGGNGSPRKKYYQAEREAEGQCATNWWSSEEYGHNQGANAELADLLGVKNVFSNPKPVKLVRGLAQIANVKSGDIVLDFFAGSGTTGEAVYQLNGEDNGTRRFIIVQLPEPLDTDRAEQEVANEFCVAAGDRPVLTSVTRQRLLRAGEKQQRAVAGQLSLTTVPTQDLGFRYYQLAPSNFIPWEDIRGQSGPSIVSQLELGAEPLVSDRTEEDVLAEILLRSGYDLAVNTERIEIDGKSVHVVSGGDMLVCLARPLSLGVVEGMAELDPSQIVVLDDGFRGNDMLKVNAAQTIRRRPNTVLKVV